MLPRGMTGYGSTWEEGYLPLLGELLQTNGVSRELIHAIYSVDAWVDSRHFQINCQQRARACIGRIPVLYFGVCIATGHAVKQISGHLAWSLSLYMHCYRFLKQTCNQYLAVSVHALLLVQARHWLHACFTTWTSSNPCTGRPDIHDAYRYPGQILIACLLHNITKHAINILLEQLLHESVSCGDWLILLPDVFSFSIYLNQVLLLINFL